MMPTPSIELSPYKTPNKRPLTSLTRAKRRHSFYFQTQTEAMMMPDLNSTTSTVLPTIKGSHSDLQCISPHTMKEVLEGKYSTVFAKTHIVDCRFPYEYHGGHIRTAVNVPNCNELDSIFMKSISEEPILIIFYCEFSSKRGPSGYRHLRHLDRQMNFANYPQLNYPHVYLLEGGYKNFFETYQEYCDPQAYIEMKDKRFCDDCRENCKELKQRGFKRSRSLTFGAFRSDNDNQAMALSPTHL